jgi:hypothetical protein
MKSAGEGLACGHIGWRPALKTNRARPEIAAARRRIQRGHRRSTFVVRVVFASIVLAPHAKKNSHVRHGPSVQLASSQTPNILSASSIRRTEA